MYKPNKVITYIDLSKFSDNLVKKLGFSYKETIEPNINWYNMNSSTLYIDINSNNTFLIDNGYLPIYDCGYVIYEYNN